MITPGINSTPVDVCVVRIAAKELTALVMDEERLRTERTDRKSWKSRVTGIEEYGGGHHAGPSLENPRRREGRQRRENEEDIEMRLALEASKNEAEEERKRRERAAGNADDDDDLAKAIKLDRKSTRLNSSHSGESRMPSSA